MKRIIAFVISFTLSLLFFFSSTAMADEVQVAIPEVTSQSIQLPPVKVNSAFFLTPKPEIKIPVLQEIFSREQTDCLPQYICSATAPNGQECTTCDKLPGRCMSSACVPYGTIAPPNRAGTYDM